jgi:N-methylhydantoinase B
MVGGAGGRALEDGADGSGANQGFLKNTPIEISETEVPMRFSRYGLKQDSGGPGLHRGGLGTEMAFTAFAPNTRVTARNRDRTIFAGWGIKGGKPGATSAFWINRDKPNAVNLKNTDIVKIGPGDSIYVACGGASGWGDPLERDAAKVALDVRRGFVSVTAAAEDYGVVIENGEADVAATDKLRADMRAKRGPLSNSFFDYGPSRDAHEAVWTEANYARLTELLASTPVHWRFYLKHRIFDAVTGLPADARKGDGSEISAIFGKLLDEFPQLRPT